MGDDVGMAEATTDELAVADGHARYVVSGDALGVHDVLHLAPYEWLAGVLAGAESCCDLGSGTGYGVDRLSRDIGDVLGIEQSPMADQHARETYPERNYRQGDVTDTTLPAEVGRQFDAVISLQVIEHVEDVPSMIGNMRDLVTDDGVVVVATPNRRYTYRRYPNSRLSDPTHVLEFTPEMLVFSMGAFFEDVQLVAQRLGGVDIGEAAHRMDAVPSDRERAVGAVKRLVPAPVKAALRRNRPEPSAEGLTIDDVEFIADPDDQALAESISLIAVCRGPRRE